jgi:hypothetical protein
MKPVKELDRWTCIKRFKGYWHIHSPYSKIIEEYNKDDLNILARHLLSPAFSLEIYRLILGGRTIYETTNK